MAKVETREADIPGATKPSKDDVQQNISKGEYGADNVVNETKKRTITLSESQLRQIIREVLIGITTEDQNIIEEGKIGKALGAAALGGVLMLGHPQNANAQLNVVSQQKASTKQGSTTGNIKPLLNVNDYGKVILYASDKQFYLSLSTRSRGYIWLELGKTWMNAIKSLTDIKTIIEQTIERTVVSQEIGGKLEINGLPSGRACLVKKEGDNERGCAAILGLDDIEMCIDCLNKTYSQK